MVASLTAAANAFAFSLYEYICVDFRAKGASKSERERESA